MVARRHIKYIEEWWMDFIRIGDDHDAGRLTETRDSLQTLILQHNWYQATAHLELDKRDLHRPYSRFGNAGIQPYQHRLLDTRVLRHRTATQGAAQPSPEHTRRGALDRKMKPRALACRLKLAAARCQTNFLSTVGSSAADERGAVRQA